MDKVYISDNTATGKKCKKWAMENMPKGFKITNRRSKCDVFISVGYDKILTKDFIKSRRCFNFHPARLPDYRGVGGCTWPILNGDEWHYATLHEIDEGIDTGKVIWRTAVYLEDTDTARSLQKKTGTAMFYLFKAYFEDLLLNYYILAPPDPSPSKLYTRKDLKDLLDLTPYMRATHYPGKAKPFYINSKGDKIELNYE